MRTVRSAAWSRNRPRRPLAWLIVLILAALIALAARVSAAEVDEAVDAEDVLDADEGVDAGADDAGDERAELAEPSEDEAIELAIQFADALTGGVSDPTRAPTLAIDNGELDPASGVTADDAVYAVAPAGAAEQIEQAIRHQRPSPWGRLDVGMSWRRHWSEPMRAPPHLSDELWLVATWRR